ncbi:hypothetical protein BayCH28_07690 [Mycolicibacterium sp. CH28]|uniref:hypothetical protein n=1 Tax=Mycolicibacterium sp. CH28 TaxID=2512237 RepID=UPI0010800137|nr:hypothetical protein [Mycolicibacterium sp. CH28]TGD89229.1 hypothetical protein BayCH28_07690 [Mycolicibacterium sp. CH28]
MGAKVRDDLVLSHAAIVAEVDAPFEHVNIEQWLKTLPTHEYQRCAPPDHKAAGYTVDDDGTPMSINVEMIGTGLVIQQYRFEVSGPHYCKMVSLSDVFTPQGWTTTQVVWELKMEQIDGDRCRYTNTVTSHPTEDFLEFVTRNGQTFPEAAAARQEASGRHCEKETPLYAKSIARWASERAAGPSA